MNGEKERLELTAEWAAKLDLQNLSDDEREFLAVCQLIRRSDRGFTTPFEHFLVSLIRDFAMGFYHTPESLKKEVDGDFKDDWETVTECTRYTLTRHPDLIAADVEAAYKKLHPELDKPADPAKLLLMPESPSRSRCKKSVSAA